MNLASAEAHASTIVKLDDNSPVLISAHDSIFDVSARLACVLLGRPLVLTASCVAFLIGGAAILLGLTCIRTRLLAGVARLLALLRLVCRPRYSGQTCKRYRNHRSGEQRLQLRHFNYPPKRPLRAKLTMQEMPSPHDGCGLKRAGHPVVNTTNVIRSA